ncbi:uncharacterized protein LOC125776697 isoform X2 [Bactrocera dorsalis]|uniref:Uncharacterized protein LOC125776697 isoform X2 n=1 Tax=Bactrocera dorsalis TaxID=27457 RepID=A0ABM3JAD2_BACDO|nr:uncharacterized protein LOC125776697 isoform X2 [Bactrocera dorsalis]
MDSPALFDAIDFEEFPTTSSTPVKEQLTLKRKKFDISGCYNSEAKRNENNLAVDGNVFNMLKTISAQLEVLTTRVSNMEKKMDSYMKENVSLYCSISIHQYRERIVLLLYLLTAYIHISFQIIHKSEEMAQQKTVRECKVLIRKIHHSVCRLTGEEIDSMQTEVASTLPITTIAAALEMDEKLKCEEFATATRHIYIDEFLFLCNWDGRGGKQPLSKFLLASNILYDSFVTCGLANFEKQIRKSIEMSHHRYKQKKYRKRKAVEESNESKKIII